MWVNPFQMKDWIKIPVILHVMLSTDQNKLIDIVMSVKLQVLLNRTCLISKLYSFTVTLSTWNTQYHLPNMCTIEIIDWCRWNSIGSSSRMNDGMQIVDIHFIWCCQQIDHKSFTWLYKLSSREYADKISPRHDQMRENKKIGHKSCYDCTY